MQIGIDARPLEGTKAGIGAYVEGLLSGLTKVDKNNHYLLFVSQPIETSFGPNFQTKIISPSPLWHLQVSRYVASHKLIYHATHSLLDSTFIKSFSILTLHDLSGVVLKDYHTWKVKTLNKLFFKRALKNAGQVITPTQVVKDDLAILIPEAVAKTRVIYEAVEDDFGAKANREALKKFHLDPGYILFNATLEPRKNVPFLLQAYNKLKRKPPLVLAGKRGWGYTEIEKEIRNLQLEDQVRILDWVPQEDLESLYQFASLFVYPSLSEGFGLSPLKAFKVGVPVIVSDIPVFNEVVGEAALKVKLTDKEGLTEAMTKILGDKNLRQKLIQKGFNQVSKYSWEKTAKQTLEVYLKVHHESS